MSVQMKYVCRPRVKRDIYWENFIWSLNEANHILDFSKLFSNKELVFIFISPWCFDFIYSSCDLLFVEWWRFLYPFQFKINYWKVIKVIIQFQILIPFSLSVSPIRLETNWGEGKILKNNIFLCFSSVSFYLESIKSIWCLV